MAVVGMWWVIEQILLGQAREELQLQTLRRNASNAELSELKLRKTRVEELLAIDARLREIRRCRADSPISPITSRRAPGLPALRAPIPALRSTVAPKGSTGSATRSPI
jgi:hypothetical protein